MEQSGDNRATQFLIQKAAIHVQCGNAASVMATIPSTRNWAEFTCLSIKTFIANLISVFVVVCYASQKKKK